MLKELIEYSNNIKEEMKFTLGEIKKNLQGTNSNGKKSGIQINDLEHKEEINSQPEQNEETRTQKNDDSVRRLEDISKCVNTWIIGMPEEEEQDIKNLFEKIIKENFSNLVKEIDIQVQEAQCPKWVKPKEGNNKTHHN